MESNTEVLIITNKITCQQSSFMIILESLRQKVTDEKTPKNGVIYHH